MWMLRVCCSGCFEAHGEVAYLESPPLVEHAIPVKGLWSIVLDEGLYLKKMNVR